jgi:hypothetical protein
VLCFRLLMCFTSLVYLSNDFDGIREKDGVFQRNGEFKVKSGVLQETHDFLMFS